MSKKTLKLHIAARVRSLKVGEHFFIESESERQVVCRVAKSLKDAGVITVDIVTKKDGDKFKVAAI